MSFDVLKADTKRLMHGSLPVLGTDLPPRPSCLLFLHEVSALLLRVSSPKKLEPSRAQSPE
eukprot:304403-Pleurochrysis_carterae.AAC.1